MWQITMPIALPALPFVITQDLVPSPIYRNLLHQLPTLTFLQFFVNDAFFQLHLIFNIILDSDVQHNC